MIRFGISALRAVILKLRPAAWGQVGPPYGQTHPNIANVATLQTASNFWGLAKSQTDGLCRITSLWPENDRAGEDHPAIRYEPSGKPFIQSA